MWGGGENLGPCTKLNQKCMVKSSGWPHQNVSIYFILNSGKKVDFYLSPEFVLDLAIDLLKLELYTKLAWPLRKDDTKNRELFHIFPTQVV